LRPAVTERFAFEQGHARSAARGFERRRIARVAAADDGQIDAQILRERLCRHVHRRAGAPQIAFLPHHMSLRRNSFPDRF